MKRLVDCRAVASVLGWCQRRLGPMWWHVALLFAVHRLGDLINLYVGLWLVPKWVSPSELGAILPLGQVGAFLSLPLMILLAPFAKFLNTFAARGEVGKVKALLLDVLLLTGCAGVAVAGYTYWAAPFILERLRIDRFGLVWILAGIALVNALGMVVRNAIQALKLFRDTGVIGTVTPPLRLLLLLATLPALGVSGYLGSQLVADALGVVLCLWALRFTLGPRVARASYKGHMGAMLVYTLPVIVGMVAARLQGTVEMLVIRHRLPDMDSAAFYLLSRFAEIPLYIWSAVSIVLFPIISEKHERGADTRGALGQVMGVTALAGGAIVILLAVFGEEILCLSHRWAVYREFAPLLWQIAAMHVCRSVGACFVTHEMACSRFTYMWYSTPVQLAEAGFLYAIMGWGFFRGTVPDSLWQVVAGLDVRRLSFVVAVMLAFAVAGMAAALVHWAVSSRRTRSVTAAATQT